MTATEDAVFWAMTQLVWFTNTYVSEDRANYIFNTEYYSSTRSIMIYQSARCRNQMIIITAVRISSIKVGPLRNGGVEVQFHHS
jgi:hypothetical protein